MSTSPSPWNTTASHNCFRVPWNGPPPQLGDCKSCHHWGKGEASNKCGMGLDISECQERPSRWYKPKCRNCRDNPCDCDSAETPITRVPNGKPLYTVEETSRRIQRQNACPCDQPTSCDRPHSCKSLPTRGREQWIQEAYEELVRRTGGDSLSKTEKSNLMEWAGAMARSYFDEDPTITPREAVMEEVQASL